VYGTTYTTTNVIVGVKMSFSVKQSALIAKQSVALKTGTTRIPLSNSLKTHSYAAEMV